MLISWCWLCYFSSHSSIISLKSWRKISYMYFYRWRHLDKVGISWYLQLRFCCQEWVSQVNSTGCRMLPLQASFGSMHVTMKSNDRAHLPHSELLTAFLSQTHKGTECKPCLSRSLPRWVVASFSSIPSNQARCLRVSHPSLPTSPSFSSTPHFLLLPPQKFSCVSPFHYLFSICF